MRPSASLLIHLVLIGILPSPSNTMMEPSPPAVGDWPWWGGPLHNWSSSESGWRKDWPDDGPPVLWKGKVGTGFSPISVSGNHCYTMGNHRGIDTIYCLDADTGSLLWKYSYRCELYSREHDGGPAGAPAICDDRVFALSREADLICLNADSGELVWSSDLSKVFGVYPPFYGFTSSPLILKDKLIVDVGVVGCFNRKSGKLAWKSEDFGGGYSSPIPLDLEGEQCFAVFNTYGVVVFGLESGREIGRYRWETRFNTNVATLIADDNRVFLSSGYEAGCALIEISPATQPTLIYHSQNMRNQYHSCVLFEGNLYGFDGDHRKNALRCVDFETGEVRWTESSLKDGSVLLADGTLVVLTGNGEVVLGEASPEGFQPLRRAHLLGGKCWTRPTLSNEKLFIRNSKGDVACYDLRK